MSFRELVAKAHMKVMIANHDNSFSFIKSKKDKVEFKRNVKFTKTLIKEIMSVD